jgi:Protein of unknown function (DUF3048) N-terminal domain/Protein of unknown function (DUF3048) C-terminal domain
MHRPRPRRATTGKKIRRENLRVSKGKKIGLGVGAGVIALAGASFFLLAGKDPGDIPIVGGLIDEPAVCALSGAEPDDEALVDRPAVAVKVENAAVAYPLSGLEDAEVVYEELVEGGVTRFMAIYHCTDSTKVGPVRSARIVDPGIVSPITKILAYSGQNAPVLEALEDAEIVRLEENVAGEGLVRIERPGLTMEHTLYANTTKLRKKGARKFSDPPADLFTFGELEGKSKKASSVTLNFNPSNAITYEWDGDGWLRTEGGAPFMTEAGDQLKVTNVLIEEHEVNLSDTIFDTAGNPSTEIGDVTGTGRAVLFRDGRMIKGTWERESEESPVVFLTKEGDEMVFAPGSIWIALLPSQTGEVQGSFDHAR